MGFLDHSTNNIILDAVLTDEGRRALARNDGSFSVTKFAVGDDEVNYNIIKKYGKAVGKEKIERNTPVFESLTNQGYGQKYKVFGVSNPNLVYLPKMGLKTAAGPVILKTRTGNVNNQSFLVEVQQSLTESQNFDAGLVDTLFTVEMNSLFLQTSGDRVTMSYIDSQNRSFYEISGVPTNNTSGVLCNLSFTVSARPNLTDDVFTRYGDPFKTYIKITGVSSGTVLDIPVTIFKT